MTARSNLREVRNPILALPAMQEVHAAPPEVRALLRRLLQDLRVQALAKADESQAKNKYMMVAYWRVAAVYLNHIQRVLK